MIELDRRLFLRSAALLSIAALGWLNAACAREGIIEGAKRSETPYTVETLQKFGRELSAWRLSNGTFMAETFLEIKKCADLLTGSFDPAQYFPFIKVPIGFSILPDAEKAALVMEKIADPNDSRKIVVTTRVGQVLYAPILARNTSVDVALSQDILNSSIRMPILVKELSQLVDYPDYARTFVDYLKSAYRVKFTLQNPNNIPTSDNEVFISIANNTALENTLIGRELFRLFVDNGSFIRAGIAFANWYEDQLHQGFRLEGKVVTTGLRSRFFLERHGLIRKEGDLFVWKNGQSPKINDPKFLELVDDISKG